MKLDPQTELVVRNTAFLATGLALLLREGVSPNVATKSISDLVGQGFDGGEIMADYLTEYVLPEVIKSTIHFDEMKREYKPE